MPPEEFSNAKPFGGREYMCIKVWFSEWTAEHHSSLSFFFLFLSSPHIVVTCVDLRPSSMSSLSATCHSTWTRSSGCFPSAARPVTLSPWRKQRSRLTLAPSTQVTIAVGLSLLHPSNHPRVLSHLADTSSSPGNMDLSFL